MNNKEKSLEELILLAMEQNIIICDTDDGWISVNEKLPEEYQPVLVYHIGNYPKGYNNMQTAYWRNDGIDGEIEVEWLNADSGFGNNNTVSHWMYLPELPINK